MWKINRQMRFRLKNVNFVILEIEKNAQKSRETTNLKIGIPSSLSKWQAIEWNRLVFILNHLTDFWQVCSLVEEFDPTWFLSKSVGFCKEGHFVSAVDSFTARSRGISANLSQNKSMNDDE